MHTPLSCRAIKQLAAALVLTLSCAGLAAQTVDICDRTAQVQEEILSETSTDGTCAAVLASELAAIIDLNLAFAHITSLRAGDFSGLSGLKFLDLTTNDLSTLPATVFSELANLQILDLPGNLFSTLPVGVFSGLSSLETLNLGNNALSSLPAGVFSELSSLEALSVSNGSFRTLPAGVFSGLGSLASLEVTGTDLRMLPAGIFSGLRSLISLQVTENGFSTLPADIFSELSSLRMLNLRGNELSSLPAGVFSGLSDLVEVNLSFNPGATFMLVVRPEFVPSPLPNDFTSAMVRLALSEGAPRATTVSLTATGADLSGDSLTIPAGGTESTGVVEITRTADAFELTLSSLELGGADSDYPGFAIVPAAPVRISSGVRLRLRVFLEGALE